MDFDPADGRVSRRRLTFMLALGVALTLALLPAAGVDARATKAAACVSVDLTTARFPASERGYLPGARLCARQFTQRKPTGPLVAFTRAGRQDESFPRVERGGEVTTVVGDGVGGIYVAGRFTTLGGIRCPALGHIRRDGTVDREFCPRPDGSVEALALAGSRLYVGGSFKHIAGAAKVSLAALNTHDGRLALWRPSVAEGVLDFSQITATPRAVYVATYSGAFYALDPGSGKRLRFAPQVEVLTAHGDGVNGFAVWGSRIYAWGGFDRIGGKLRPGVGLVDAETGKALPWQPPKLVTSGLLVGRTLYLAGGFRSIGAHPRGGLAAFDAATGKLQGWSAQSLRLGVVSGLHAAGSVLYGAGSPSYADDTQVAFARSLTSGTALRFGVPKFNGFAGVIAHVGDKIVFGGQFDGLVG